jgi:hypothetical protein
MSGARGLIQATLGSAIAALAIAAAGGAPARELTWIGDVWTKPDECPFNRAQPVALDKVAADPKAFVGRCVLIRGIARGTWLSPEHPSPAATGGPAVAIGVYGLKHLGVRLDRPVVIEVAGRIHRCFGVFHETYCDAADKDDRVFIAASEVELSDDRPVTPPKPATPPRPQQ